VTAGSSTDGHSGDRIVLTIPRDEGFEDVAQLVLGGVASRLNLTFESLDDLGTGLATLLERRGDDGDLTVELRVEDDRITTLIGPFHGDAVTSELDRPDDGVGLRRVLETVVDGFSALDRGDGHWVELQKRIESGSGG
jgi:hypothetical protein